ncbi:MAG: hypothetical protein MR902_04215 [Campylobacter sp.]|nr:hypothetical protein [Campylobacter sp.]
MYRCKSYLILFLCLFCASLKADMNVTNFSNENDFLIMQALDTQESNTSKSISIYYNIYKKTLNPTYLRQACILGYLQKDENLPKLMSEGIKVLMDDEDFLLAYTAYSAENNELENALTGASFLLYKNPSDTNYFVFANVLTNLGFYDEAYKNYEKAYQNSPKEAYAVMMAKIAVNELDDIQKAKLVLENHQKNSKENSPLVLSMLADIYAYVNDTQNLSKTYTLLYESTKDIEYMAKLAQLMINIGEYKKAASIMERYNINDYITLEILISINEPERALNVAKKGYKNTKDEFFLANVALLEYEIYGKNATKYQLDEIIQNFEKSVYKVNVDLYYNYYGYLLIEHEIDIKKGIELVEKALSFDEFNPYYIDSLAWGYFKLNDCKMASEIIGTIDSEFVKNSSEIKEHIKIINECLKKGE